jgi:hypothetical protein
MLNSNTAFPIYQKLYSRLAVMVPPFKYMRRDEVEYISKQAETLTIYYPDDTYSIVRWMPKMLPGWRRLTYHEFLLLYNIKIVDEKGMDRNE